MSWVVDTELLILEVESRPFLYAKGLPEYSNKIMKNNAWEEITKNLSEDWVNLTNEEKNNDCKDLQLKWKHVRDNFRREYQIQRDVTSGQGAKKKKKYRYYDELLFLVPYVTDAKTYSNYSAPTPTNKEDQTFESPAASNLENLPPGQFSNITGTQKRKRKTTSSFEDERDDTDEDRAFCLSLVPSLKKMDDDNKMLLKIEMLKLIRMFSNRSHSTIVTETNQIPLMPYFNNPNQIYSSPICMQTTQQPHLQPGTAFMYSQNPQHNMYSQSTFTPRRNMYQQQPESYSTPSKLHQSKPPIKILENLQYRPAYSTAPSPRPQSAQSFFTTYTPNICPSPSNTVQSPIINISSPEDFNLSSDDC